LEALAQRASPDVTLESIGSDLLRPIHQSVFDAQAIYFDTPISRFLIRPEGPVYLSRLADLGHKAVSGSCYHDLGLAVAVRTLEGAQNSELARDFVRAFRYRTAAGDEVALHLQSLIPSVCCESQRSISRWLADIQLRLQPSKALVAAQTDLNQAAVGPEVPKWDQFPILSEQQENILKALYLLKAFHPGNRKSTRAVALRADGSEANPEAFKEPIAELKRLGLVETKEGRGGGCWLMLLGREYVKQKLKS